MSHVDLHLHLLPGRRRRSARRGGEPRPRRAPGPRGRPRGHRHAARRPPAYPLDVATIAERTRALQAAIAAEGIELLLHPGGEIHPPGAAPRRRRPRPDRPRPSAARAGSCSRSRSPASTLFLDACRHSASGLRPADRPPRARRGLLAGGLVRCGPSSPPARVLQVSVCSLLGRHGPEAHEAAGTARPRRGLPTSSPPTGTAAAIARTRWRPDRPRRSPPGASPLRVEQLTRANPRFLLRDGIPREPRPDDRVEGHRSLVG